MRSLRQENQQLNRSLATRLGIELTHPDPVELADRLNQVEQHNRDSVSELAAARDRVQYLEDELVTLRDDLTAAREGLRRMIRQRAGTRADAG